MDYNNVPTTHHYTYTYCTVHYARVEHAIGLMIAGIKQNLVEDEDISVLALNIYLNLVWNILVFSSIR